MAKVINIWWVLLLIGLFSTALSAQSTIPQLKDRLSKTSNTGQKASLNYKIAEAYLNMRKPPFAVRYGQEAYKLAEQARKTGLQSGAALLMGKSFIAQNDFANANLWIKRGINLGKSIQSAPLVVEGSVLLSSIAVRQNNYKLAHEHLLVGVNYYNRFPGSAKSNPSPSIDPAELKRLKRQVADLSKREKGLLEQMGKSESELAERAANMEDSLRSIYAKDDAEEISQGLAEVERSKYELALEKAEQKAQSNSILGIPNSWWVLILAVLSLALIAGLFWLWSRLSEQENSLDESEVYSKQNQALQEELHQGKENWQNELRQKELLIEDYKQELFDLQNKKSLAATLFGKTTEGAIRERAGLMIIDLSAPDDQLNAKYSLEKVEQLERELNLLIQQHSSIHFVNKIGPKMIFVTKPEAVKSGTKALIEFAEELKDYFSERPEATWSAKIAVHSGWLVFAKSENLPQGVNVWGEELDRCSWLLDQTQPGNITITSDARDEIANPEGWTYLGEQRDFLGKEIRIFKKT